MPKTPFEKVKSLVERRKLFEGLLREQTEVLCKGEDDSLFHVKPTAIVGDMTLQGFMISIEKVPEKDVEVIGNFSVGSDRYFFCSVVKVEGSDLSLPINCDVYRLQRRASIRLHLPPNYGIYFAVTEFQGRPAYAIAQIADISAGGARIFFSEMNSPVPVVAQSKPLDLRINDEFRGVLHLSSQKTMEVQARVKHVQKSVYHGQIVDHLGIEFVELTPRAQNRLLSMSMDIQRRLMVED